MIVRSWDIFHGDWFYWRFGLFCFWLPPCLDDSVCQWIPTFPAQILVKVKWQSALMWIIKVKGNFIWVAASETGCNRISQVFNSDLPPDCFSFSRPCCPIQHLHSKWTHGPSCDWPAHCAGAAGHPVLQRRHHPKASGVQSGCPERSVLIWWGKTRRSTNLKLLTEGKTQPWFYSIINIII